MRERVAGEGAGGSGVWADYALFLRHFFPCLRDILMPRHAAVPAQTSPLAATFVAPKMHEGPEHKTR